MLYKLFVHQNGIQTKYHYHYFVLLPHLFIAMSTIAACSIRVSERVRIADQMWRQSAEIILSGHIFVTDAHLAHYTVSPFRWCARSHSTEPEKFFVGWRVTLKCHLFIVSLASLHLYIHHTRLYLWSISAHIEIHSGIYIDALRLIRLLFVSRHSVWWVHIFCIAIKLTYLLFIINQI